ncbi:DUF1146 domain-containing protein [Limosilactobacillus difficilis]|uniref:DUF1146 domain-containing protein n=1 Tax=Limosilactobacillus difficilis TaxID=2991838 RepID=UPI0024B8D263|nr:DUF1146 domain-containing protein [Limosilactobacillus difficilis]
MTNATAVINLILAIGFTYLAFRAIMGLHPETMWHRPPQTLSLLIVLVSIAIGYGCAQFFSSFFVTLYDLLLSIK